MSEQAATKPKRRRSPVDGKLRRPCRFGCGRLEATGEDFDDSAIGEGDRDDLCWGPGCNCELPWPPPENDS